MNQMIKLEQLNNLKLITDESVYRTEEQAVDRLELAVQQGIGGWGVRPDDGVILKLARDLRLALEMSKQQEETFNKLKGTQMENGRLKKRLENVEAQLALAITQLTEQGETIKVARVEIDSLTHALEESSKTISDLAGADVPSSEGLTSEDS